MAAAFGYQSKVLACATGAIVLTHIDDEGRIVHIRASKVGENGVRANVWYSLDAAGEFVEVEE